MRKLFICLGLTAMDVVIPLMYMRARNDRIRRSESPYLFADSVDSERILVLYQWFTVSVHARKK